MQWRLAQVAAQALPHGDGFLGASSLEGVATPALSGLTADMHSPRSGVQGAGGVVELGPVGGSGNGKGGQLAALPVAEELPLLDRS